MMMSKRRTGAADNPRSRNPVSTAVNVVTMATNPKSVGPVRRTKLASCEVSRAAQRVF